MQTFDDLSSISGDIDPTTALPYAPLSVLQAAHWSAADIKARVLSEKMPPSAADGELGLTQSTAEISTMYNRMRVRSPRRLASPSSSGLQTMSFSALSLSSTGYTSSSNVQLYHPVPADDTHRIGAGGLLFFNNNAASAAPIPGINGMPELGPEWNGNASSTATTSRTKPLAPSHSEATFFGILRGARRGPEIEAKFRESGGSLVPLPGMDKIKEERWSKIEPFRCVVPSFIPSLLLTQTQVLCRVLGR